MRKHILLTVLLAGIHIPYQETKSMSEFPQPMEPVEVKTYEVIESVLRIPNPQHEYSYPLAKKIESRGTQWTVASISAYSCNGIKNEAQRKMNCPSSKKHPGGRTATGTTPQPNRTLACDRSLLGKRIEIEGLGSSFFCEDLGGVVKGHKIDLYVSSIQEAKQWGRKNLRYRVVDNS